MPTSASVAAAIAPSLSAGVVGAWAQNRPVPEDLIGRLSSIATSYEAKLEALREVKSQIIGNRTKKMSFLKLGAVPSAVAVLSSATSTAAARIGCGVGGDYNLDSIIIQSAAAVGSFACGFDAGALPILFS